VIFDLFAFGAICVICLVALAVAGMMSTRPRPPRYLHPPGDPTASRISARAFPYDWKLEESMRLAREHGTDHELGVNKCLLCRASEPGTGPAND